MPHGGWPACTEDPHSQTLPAARALPHPAGSRAPVRRGATAPSGCRTRTRARPEGRGAAARRLDERLRGAHVALLEIGWCESAGDAAACVVADGDPDGQLAALSRAAALRLG
jgi:hypothetical protein